ncbi:hypothetical protein [Geothermobacter ehrlichii]|nr:hypothetical protein [Geothermobacter ehrlichii]
MKKVTRVVPTWVKVAGLAVLTGYLGYHLIAEEPSRVPATEKPLVVTPGPGIERGLPGKILLNTRQVVTGNVFSPVVEPDEAPVVIRESDGKPFYADE